MSAPGKTGLLGVSGVPGVPVGGLVGSGPLDGALSWALLAGSVVCAAVAVRQLWRCRRVRHRAREVLGRPDARTGAGAGFAARARQLSGRVRSRGLREAGAAVGVGGFAVVLVDGAAGWVLAGVGAYGVWRWLRRRTAGADTDTDTDTAADADTDSGQDVRAETGQLPLAAELLAACLAAGSGPAQAADAVGRSLGGPLGIRLIRTAMELRLGAEPAVAWARFTGLPGGAGFVRSMERAGTAGAPAVAEVTRLTGELRARCAREASARARRAAVLVTGPLGLCFLPAFLAVGVAPVVMGLARSLL